MKKKLFVVTGLIMMLSLSGCASGKRYEAVGTAEPSEVPVASTGADDPREGWVNVYSTTNSYSADISKRCDGPNLIYKSVEHAHNATSISVVADSPECYG